MNAPVDIAPELARLFAQLRLGTATALGDITFFPLLYEADLPDADLLEEGLRESRTEVAEVNERGDVNRVRVTHSGVRPLLLLDGEEVIGAKQNRIFNASFVVAAGQSVVLPVSCVERGRWHSVSQGFAASGTTVTTSVRASKLRRVTRSVMAGSGYDADQGAVWRDVAGYIDRSRVVSTTAAFSDAYRSRSQDVEPQLERIRPIAGQVGYAAVRGGALVGLDIFGSPALFARAWKKVARGVLGEVYDGVPADGDPLATVTSLLHDLAVCRVVRQDAPGCGQTLHGSVGKHAIGAVVHEGRVYHAAVAAA